MAVRRRLQRIASFRSLAGTGAVPAVASVHEQVDDGTGEQQQPGQDADHVGPMLEELMADPARRSRMSVAARSLSRPGAADELAAWALELAEGRTSKGDGDAV